MKERFIRLKCDFLALNTVEKIFNILVFAAMTTVTVIQIVTKDDGMKTVQLVLNIFASLALYLTHILFKPTSLLGGLSLKMQKYINIVVLIGSFGGQYFVLGDYYSNYDTATHLVTGCVFCLFGLGMYEYQAKEEAFRKPALATAYSFFFSMFAALFWEVFEFSSDFLLGGTCQGYNLTLDSDKFFYFKWFESAAKPELQYALYDTFADVYAALITGVITAVIILIALKKKKASLTEKEKEEVTAKG